MCLSKWHFSQLDSVPIKASPQLYIATEKTFRSTFAYTRREFRGAHIRVAFTICSLVTDFSRYSLEILFCFIYCWGIKLHSAAPSLTWEILFRKLLKAIYISCKRNCPASQLGLPRKMKRYFSIMKRNCIFWLRHTFMHELCRDMRLRNGTKLVRWIPRDGLGTMALCGGRASW